MRRALLSLLLLMLPLAAWGYEDEMPDDSLSDDHTQHLAHVRQRLAAKDNATVGGKYGVVMVTGPKDEAHAQLTVPLWREYCKKHGYGFWLQQEPLSTDFSFGWSKPRLLMELLPAVKWRYMLVVDANTVPKKFGMKWDTLIKSHMRYKRWNNDDTSKRHMFCPWDCEDEYDSPYEDGSCSGPITSVCIYWTAKAKTRNIVRRWYATRLSDEIPQNDDGVFKGLEQVKTNNFYEEVFYRDVAEDLGRPSSKLIPAFSYHKEYRWNLRDQIHDYIKKDKVLAEIANTAAKRAESGEL